MWLKMDLVEIYTYRRSRVKRELERILNDEVKIANRDHHARRKIRPCGFTVHTGIGCSASCLYCYIYDMGFTVKTARYPLTPLGLIYSLTLNPYLVFGENGTFLALGSVTEPFLHETKNYTLELISYINKYLGNPTQISTKWVLTQYDINRLFHADRHISILYTIVAYDLSRKLEPKAPSINLRFEIIKCMIKAGLKVALFIRPIIPGITDKEIDKIFNKAVDIGIKDIVIGTLRVTKGIYEKLSVFPEVKNQLKRRISQELSSKQILVHSKDLKEKIMRKAYDYELNIFPSACAVNAYHHNLFCNICRFGPCVEHGERIYPEIEQIYEFIKWLGMDGNVKLNNDDIFVIIYNKHDKSKIDILKYVLMYIYKMRLKISFRRWL